MRVANSVYSGYFCFSCKAGAYDRRYAHTLTGRTPSEVSRSRQHRAWRNESMAGPQLPSRTLLSNFTKSLLPCGHTALFEQ